MFLLPGESISGSLFYKLHTSSLDKQEFSRVGAESLKIENKKRMFARIDKFLVEQNYFDVTNGEITKSERHSVEFNHQADGSLETNIFDKDGKLSESNKTESKIDEKIGHQFQEYPGDIPRMESFTKKSFRKKPLGMFGIYFFMALKNMF